VAPDQPCWLGRSQVVAYQLQELMQEYRPQETVLPKFARRTPQETLL
jgi:hypothetical protein